MITKTILIDIIDKGVNNHIITNTIDKGIIRKAINADLPKLADVDCECNSVVINRLMLGRKEIIDALCKRFGEQNKEFYVYEIVNESKEGNKNKEILGYATLKLEFPGYKNCELSWIAVRQKYQHKGIGKKLVEFIEALTRKKGFRNIYAYTSEKENDKVQGFYNRLEYKRINAFEDYYSDGTRAVLFGKKLNE